MPDGIALALALVILAGTLAAAVTRPWYLSEAVAATAGSVALLADAETRLGRPARREARRGNAEREVVAAAEHVDVLVLARDGDHQRLGPRSLGPAARFVVDHAPAVCC